MLKSVLPAAAGRGESVLSVAKTVCHHLRIFPNLSAGGLLFVSTINHQENPYPHL
jgi:hypothetical protein